MKFSDIIKRNNELGSYYNSFDYKIGIVSNIIVTQSKHIIEMPIRNDEISAEVDIGDYDNIIQDSNKFRDYNCVVVFWELANVIDGFQYKVENLNSEKLDALIKKTKQEILLCLENLQNTPLVIFNRFSTLVFNYANIRKNKFDYICEELNLFLDELKFRNLILIDIDKVISKVGIDASVDLRYFYSSKALYSVEFYKEYSRYISSIILGAKGKSKKALIFDCDNTLWKGVLGEDGSDNIKMSSKTSDGIVFEEIQSIAVSLAKKGVIIGLCSKNNASDIENLFKNNLDITLKNEYIVIKKINWDDKVSNLISIGKELNIGLDSIVFVDDSDFEVNLIQEHLPMITVLQVPKKLATYPRMIKDNIELFFNLSRSEDDLKRLGEYKNQTKRDNEKEKFDGIDDYLKSLGINLVIHQNNKQHIPRIAQMTQKTNQFNLTTKRYTESEIEQFMNEKTVYSVEVSDKFGNSGITALIILELGIDDARIDSFLMSCRIIGRNIEFAISDYIVHELNLKGITKCSSKYIKTLKNSQVENFYELIEFNLQREEDITKEYILDLRNYKNKNIEYIGVVNGTKN